MTSSFENSLFKDYVVIDMHFDDYKEVKLF